MPPQRRLRRGYPGTRPRSNDLPPQSLGHPQGAGCRSTARFPRLGKPPILSFANLTSGFSSRDQQTSARHTFPPPLSPANPFTPSFAATARVYLHLATATETRTAFCAYLAILSFALSPSPRPRDSPPDVSFAALYPAPRGRSAVTSTLPPKPDTL